MKGEQTPTRAAGILLIFGLRRRWGPRLVSIDDAGRRSRDLEYRVGVDGSGMALTARSAKKGMVLVRGRLGRRRIYSVAVRVVRVVRVDGGDRRRVERVGGRKMLDRTKGGRVARRLFSAEKGWHGEGSGGRREERG